MLAQLPEAARADLLRSQAQTIDPQAALGKVSMLPAAVCQFEFEDEPGVTMRDFEGVILGHHKRKVLWDRPYGTQPVSDDEKAPACASPDGTYGIPRANFIHPALGDRPATGTETITCANCPLAQWGTGARYNPTANPKGKACTEQKSIYIAVPGRMIPVELVISPSSLSAFDQYILRLTGRMTPVQAVVTKFTQERVERGPKKWAEARFADVAVLDSTAFGQILDMRQTFLRAIDPHAVVPAAPPPAAAGQAAAGSASTELPETPDF